MLLKHSSLCLAALIAPVFSQNCNPQLFQQGYVCKCDASGCDSIAVPDLQSGEIFIRQSVENEIPWQQGNFTFNAGQTPSYNNPDDIITITIGKYNNGKSGNIVKSLGGLMNDATAINVDKLDSSLQYSLLQSYFDTDSGLGYDTLRFPIAGTEFSTRFYTYDDADYDDGNLDEFSLQPEDTQYKIPLTARINEYFFPDGDLKTIASPWTAPPWMKTNFDYIGYGQIIGHPIKNSFFDKGYFDVWANYFVKFLQAYKDQGINIKALTMQNLPSNGMSDKPYLPIPQTAWNPVDEALFFVDYLWPAMEAAGFGDVKIYLVDDYTIEMGNDLNSAMGPIVQNGLYGKIAGVGAHWDYDYSLGGLGAGIFAFQGARYPDKEFITTGGGTVNRNGYAAKHYLGNWQEGERYSNGILEHFQWGDMTFIDGTMVVDMAGGPNCTKITTNAPIVVDDDGQTFYKNPAYYHLAHVYKFLPPGTEIMPTQKVGLSSARLRIVAGDDNNGRRSIVILNKDNIDVNVEVYDEPAAGTISMTLPAKSITSFMWQQ